MAAFLLFQEKLKKKKKKAVTEQTQQGPCKSLYLYTYLTTKFSSANFQKNVKFKLYHMESSKIRGQTV